MALTTIPSELSSVSGISDSSSSTAITINSSQEVTFAGNITTGSNTISGVLASAVTATTQAASDNSTKLATTAYVTTALANLVDSAPGTLNTLNELAAALGDDANFSTTVTNSIAGKVALSGSGQTIADSGNLTFDVVGGISLDADGGQVDFKDNGTLKALIDFTGNSVEIQSRVTDADLIFRGQDGSSFITALTLDMSEAGIATFNSGINIGNRGSASDPTLQSSIDPNTGIYWGGADILGFSTGGSERVRIDASGNVGIGIAPTKKLTVFGTGAGNATVQIEGEGGADPYINFLANNTQHWSVGIDDSDDDKFKISEHSALGTNDYFTINTSGATTLSSTGSSAGFLYLNYIRGISDGNTGINIAGSDVLELQTGGSARVRIDTALKIIGQNTSHTASALAIGHEGSSISELRAYGVNTSTVGKLRMRVSASDGTSNSDAIFDQSGLNVGGSTAANRTLEIKGASNNDGYLGTFGSGYSLQVARHPLTGVFNNTSTAASAINLFTASGDSAIAFYTTTTNNANPTERMRIDKNGIVGIGFSQPAHSGLGSMLSVGAQNIVGNGTSGGYVGYNMYYNSGNWKYQVGAGSALLSFAASGDFSLRQATSGSAGNTIAYSETFKIERSTGYLVAQGASNVRLVLGSQGNSSNNTSNWIRGNGTEVDINTAGGNFNVEIAGNKKAVLSASALSLPAGVNLKLASGQGIDFSATSDGFGTDYSELLDDYEEGIWTPVWQANTQTTSVNSARYVKVGKLVYIYCYISNIYPATSADTQYISGLPYPVVNATFYGGLTIAYAGAASFPALGNSTASIAALSQNNNTTIYFHSIGGGTNATLTRGNWNAYYNGLGGTLRALILSGCYEAG